MVNKKCSNCGTDIRVHNYRLREDNFCSSKCSALFNWKNNRRNMDVESAHESIKLNGQPKLRIGKRKFNRNSNWEKLRLRVIKRDKVCLMCQKIGDTVDHIIPVQIKLDNSLNNLQLLCKKCHSIKSGWDRKIIKEYLKTKKG